MFYYFLFYKSRSFISIIHWIIKIIRCPRRLSRLLSRIEVELFIGQNRSIKINQLVLIFITAFLIMCRLSRNPIALIKYRILIVFNWPDDTFVMKDWTLATSECGAKESFKKQGFVWLAISTIHLIRQNSILKSSNQPYFPNQTSPVGFESMMRYKGSITLFYFYDSCLAS